MPALPSKLAASRDLGDSDYCMIKVPNGKGDAPIDIDDGNICIQAPNYDAHHDATTPPDEVAIYTGFKNGTIHSDAEVFGIIAIVIGGLVLVAAVSVILCDRCKRCFHRHDPDEE
ncbi:hypothetical protein Daesc_002337 [Daldinia eschscholtzii]|uniref:Uncharacterized protein n=1 Tax=Daldinia eschscholtzii TaxID=292717 RepID=A0AAX6MY01_9PEZI